MKDMLAMIGITIVLLIAVGAGDASAGRGNLRPVPRCFEDSVLIGTGQFSQGRWTHYVCGPAVDDYIDNPGGM